MFSLGKVTPTDLLQECVARHEQKYPGDPLYIKAVSKMRALNLALITKSDVDNVVEPFLYKWGRMGRLLGQDKYRFWKENVLKSVALNLASLQVFQKTNLSKVNLKNDELQIKVCYDSMKQAVGQIGAPKVLHLICPDFFPLWDNSIARGCRVEFSIPSQKVEEFSAEDYFQFMQGIQEFLIRHNGLIGSLAQKYGPKSELRIIDECLWWMGTRPFCLIF